MAGTRVEFAAVDEFGEGDSRVIKEIQGREIAVFKSSDEYHAVLNFCVHVGGPLCEGPLAKHVVAGEGENWTEWSYDENTDVIQCPWHSWEFDIETGRSLKSSRYRVPVYDTSVEDGTVYVEI